MSEIIEFQKPDSEQSQTLTLPERQVPEIFYEVVLNPVQLHTLHAGQVALVRMYEGIVDLVSKGDKGAFEWMEKNNMTPVQVIEIYENARQMLMQFDFVINSDPLPKDADPYFTLHLRETSDRFEQP